MTPARIGETPREGITTSVETIGPCAILNQAGSIVCQGLHLPRAYSQRRSLASDIPRHSAQLPRLSPIVVSIPKAMSRLTFRYLCPRALSGIAALLLCRNGEVLVYVGQQRSALFDLHILAVLDEANGPKKYR